MDLPHHVTRPMMAAMYDWSSALARRIEERTAQVAVVGMGMSGSRWRWSSAGPVSPCGAPIWTSSG